MSLTHARFFGVHKFKSITILFASQYLLRLHVSIRPRCHWTRVWIPGVTHKRMQISFNLQDFGEARENPPPRPTDVFMQSNKKTRVNTLCQLTIYCSTVDECDNRTKITTYPACGAIMPRTCCPAGRSRSLEPTESWISPIVTAFIHVPSWSANVAEFDVYQLPACDAIRLRPLHSHLVAAGADIVSGFGFWVLAIAQRFLFIEALLLSVQVWASM